MAVFAKLQGVPGHAVEEERMLKPAEVTEVPGLTPKEREALQAYINALLEALPDQVVRIILYGSKARGEGTPESDIDLMVVIRNGEERRPDGLWTSLRSDPRWKTAIYLADDIFLEYDVYISPFLIGEQRFKHGSLLVRNVQREGIELWPRQKT